MIPKPIYLLFLLLGNYLVNFAQTEGCTDPLALNFNPSATVNNGSCIYASASIEPSSSVVMPALLAETSGLTEWNACLWTHNDNTDSHIYCIDTLSGNIIQTCLVNGAENTDWEEISQDSAYLYIGDFGNNANGNRTDLRILRISKESLLAGNPETDVISFAYADQFNFNPTGANNTNFDCEAMVVSHDSIYLFTKRWIDEECGLYALPKIPGSYLAEPRALYDVNGLVTGATYLENRRLIVLCGYSSLLSPFLYLLYDFNGHDFFGGNKRKITVSLTLHQVEGIAGREGLKYYISNERFLQPPVINVPQELNVLDLSPFLGYYLQNYQTGLEPAFQPERCSVFPDPASDQVYLQCGQDMIGSVYRLVDTAGKLVHRGKIRSVRTHIDLQKIDAGIYFLIISGKHTEVKKLIRN